MFEIKAPRIVLVGFVLAVLASTMRSGSSAETRASEETHAPRVRPARSTSRHVAMRDDVPEPKADAIAAHETVPVDGITEGALARFTARIAQLEALPDTIDVRAVAPTVARELFERAQELDSAGDEAALAELRAEALLGACDLSRSARARICFRELGRALEIPDGDLCPPDEAPAP